MSYNRNRSPDRKSQKERIKEITDQLEAGVSAVFESSNYKNYLRCLSKFTKYSTSNCLLIALQRPDASAVAGYRSWQKDHGRQVRKGAKGIKILAPCKYKVEIDEDIHDDHNLDVDQSRLYPVAEEKKTIERLGFKVVTVFDISDTEGKELPSLGVKELTGDVNGYRKLFEALTEICPVPVYIDDIEGGAKGYYNDAEKKIVIRSGMSQMQTVKTFLHEALHQKLHSKENMDPDNPIPRNVMEQEAEAVAFTVMNAIGLGETVGDYSFGYICSWAKTQDTSELKASLERIRSASDEMITAINKALERQEKREKNRASRDEAR